MANLESISNSNVAQNCAFRSCVLDIADIYINKYTCAQMADRLDTVIRESAEANNWVLAQCSDNGISMDELRSAIDEMADTKYADTACLWDVKLFNKED